MKCKYYVSWDCDNNGYIATGWIDDFNLFKEYYIKKGHESKLYNETWNINLHDCMIMSGCFDSYLGYLLLQQEYQLEYTHLILMRKYVITIIAVL